MQSRWTEEDMNDVGQKLYTVTGKHYSDEEIQETLDNGSPELIYRQALMENVSGATVSHIKDNSNNSFKGKNTLLRTWGFDRI